jgi:hypothetical protein
LQYIGHDINVTTVWEHNITGHGVVVAIVDDGRLIELMNILAVEKQLM